MGMATENISQIDKLIKDFGKQFREDIKQASKAIEQAGKAIKKYQESEEKSMLHNVTVKVEENKVLETYWTIRGVNKSDSLLRPYRELDHEPTPEEIAQFIHRNKVDYAFIEEDYRFENELSFLLGKGD